MPEDDVAPSPRTPHPAPRTDDGACAEVALAAEAMAEDIAAILHHGGQDLLLFKALPAVVDKVRDMRVEQGSGRVLWAADCALVAIAERVGRAMRRDLPRDEG